jgi:uncharacterized protein GlcG (DUF336 family)
MIRRVRRAGALAAFAAGMLAPSAGHAAGLGAADVERIIAQGIAEARALGLPVAIAVVDREGNALGVFRMAGARTFTVATGRGDVPLPTGADGVPGRALAECTSDGLEGCRLALVEPPPGCTPPSTPLPLPPGSALAALSKAGTAAFFSTLGNAFTTRTAGFIVQPHFPPLVRNAPSGPLFGVQFSQLPCGDVNPRLPFGLSADPGGMPLYRGTAPVGGVGVEGDGRYTVDLDPSDRDVTAEERIATAATRGWEAPAAIRGDRILVGGLRLPFSNVDGVPARPVPALASVPGDVDVPPAGAPPSRFVRARLPGVRGTADPAIPTIDSVDPPVAGGGLSAADVRRALARAGRQADRARAAIRRPLGDFARVNIAVVDRAGNLLGLFRTRDAPMFGVDVSVQKARTAAFFSRRDAADLLRGAGQDAFVAAAGRSGVRLRGEIAFSNRAQGFLSRPLFPDGIDGTSQGPFSVPSREFTIFNDGLQVELVKGALATVLARCRPAACTEVPGLANGIQIFPGSVPLYRRGRLIGAVGVSGDGVDQDDLVAAAGGRGFEPPDALRADATFVRGVRLPYVKFPRRPEIR